MAAFLTPSRSAIGDQKPRDTHPEAAEATYRVPPRTSRTAPEPTVPQVDVAAAQAAHQHREPAEPVEVTCASRMEAGGITRQHVGDRYRQRHADRGTYHQEQHYAPCRPLVRNEASIAEPHDTRLPERHPFDDPCQADPGDAVGDEDQIPHEQALKRYRGARLVTSPSAKAHAGSPRSPTRPTGHAGG